MLLKDACINKKNNLNFIRLIAAILVVYMHSFSISLGDEAGDIIGRLTLGKEYAGGLAVDIFFIISGFLICKSYDNSKSIVQYAKARFLRIWPLLFVVVMLLTFVMGPLVTSYEVSHYFALTKYWLYFLRNLYFVSAYTQLPGVFMNHFQNSVDGSLWTLAYEVICYIFVVISAPLWKRKKFSIPVMAVLCSAIFVFHKYINAFSVGPISAEFIRNLSRFMTYFLVGMLFYLYRDVIRLDKKLLATGILVVVVGILFLDFTICFAIGGACIIFVIGFSEKINTQWYEKIGDLSYGIYLISFPIQQLVVYFLGRTGEKLFLYMDPYINFVISLVICLPVAYLSWHFIEKPCLKLKNKKFTWKNKRVSAK